MARLIVNPQALRCFLRPPLTEAPSLRNYPASSVLRASPPPHTARPGSRELPVDPLRSPLGLPVLHLIHYAWMPSPLPRQDKETCSLVPSPRRRPSPLVGRVGSCVDLLSVHSRYGLQARGVAWATPFHRRLQRLCCLHRRSDCYRVERTSSRAGLSPAVDQRLSRRTDKKGSIHNPISGVLRSPTYPVCRPSIPY